MPLKHSEKFVQECLLKHFGCGKNDSMEGEDPPDIYLIYNDNKIAVEITTLAPISFSKTGEITNRYTEDYFGTSICREIKKIFHEITPDNVSIFLGIYVPVNDPRKYKKKLKSVIRDVLVNKLTPGTNFTKIIMETKVEFFVKKSQNYEQNNEINCVVLNTNSDPDILKNAKLILEASINTKIKKCSKNKKNNYWLALLNDYWIANCDIYKRAFSELKIGHMFDRILIVNHDTSVCNLTVKT